MGNGKGGIRLRQFNFDGRNLNKGGNFRFEIPPRKKEPKKRSDA
jgi:hypothetical protein